MKVLFISALEIKEKGAQSIRMTLEGYAAAGHEVCLLTQQKKNSADYYYEGDYIPKSDNFKIVRFGLPFAKLAPKSVLANGVRNIILFVIVGFVRGLLMNRKEKFDLIYGYEVQGILAGKPIAFLSRKKFVSRFQGTVLYPQLNKKERSNKKWLWYLYHRIAFRLSADMYIMTNDGTLGDKVLDYFKAPKDKVRFWMNGVNKGIYQPKYRTFLREKYKIDSEAKILVTVHRLTYWKKTERAITAISEILRKDRNVFLVIIGDGDRRAYLESMVRDLGIADNVFFAGGVSNDEVGKYLNGADIYLGTYDLSNAGNPLFESMLSGLAVISLNNGSTADFLGNGKAGILIKNEKYFAPQILKLLKDEKELAKWKNLAKNYAHQEFWAWDERIKKEIEEVEALVASSKS